VLLRLLLLFTLVPIVELAILIQLGREIGTGLTIALVLLTGFLGALLSKTQGIIVLHRIREELNRGNLPTGQLLDGACVLAGGLLLLTPGLLTDILGFTLLIPQTRDVYKRVLLDKIEQWMFRR